ncbi:hypothetical protein J6590_086742 [Homalodisca vitripennis]|nr:hypothetical protein J6590_086742 [Homalodisca vitripennis]
MGKKPQDKKALVLRLPKPGSPPSSLINARLEIFRQPTDLSLPIFSPRQSNRLLAESDRRRTNLASSIPGKMHLLIVRLQAYILPHLARAVMVRTRHVPAPQDSSLSETTSLHPRPPGSGGDGEDPPRAVTTGQFAVGSTRSRLVGFAAMTVFCGAISKCRHFCQSALESSRPRQRTFGGCLELRTKSKSFVISIAYITALWLRSDKMWAVLEALFWVECLIMSQVEQTDRQTVEMTRFPPPARVSPRVCLFLSVSGSGGDTALDTRVQESILYGNNCNHYLYSRVVGALVCSKPEIN